jgi:WD40 repeat protein
VRNHKAQIWDSQTGQLKATLDKSQIVSVAYLPNGKRFATGDEEGTISIWDIGTQKLLWKSDENPRTPIQLITISADGSTLATNFNGTVRLWEYSLTN